MVNEIVFYSNVHMGDLHLSRPYVKWFVDSFPFVKISYSHNYDKSIFSDIKNLNIASDEIWQSLPRQGDIFHSEDYSFVAFNTWAYAGDVRMGCNYFSLHNIFSRYLELLKQIDERFINFKLPKYLIPKIEYDRNSPYILNVENWFKNKQNDKKIFVSNNFVESNQAHNFNMSELISEWASNHLNCDFYISNKIDPLVQLDNVYYNTDIINKNGTDMIEQSYISTFCDIIIGRNSGPFSFAEVEENLNKKWITMSFNSIPQDAFNWFNLFPNEGEYFHEENILTVTNILNKLI